MLVEIDRRPGVDKKDPGILFGLEFRGTEVDEVGMYLPLRCRGH